MSIGARTRGESGPVDPRKGFRATCPPLIPPLRAGIIELRQGIEELDVAGASPRRSKRGGTEERVGGCWELPD